MSDFLAIVDDERAVAELTPEILLTLLSEAARSIEVRDRSSETSSTAHAARSDAESWRVEVRDTGPEAPLRATAANTDAVFDLLRSWAAGDGWWREAFSWEPVGL